MSEEYPVNDEEFACIRAIYGSLANETVSESSEMLLSGLPKPKPVTAKPVQCTQEWQQSVTPDLRNHLVHAVFKMIFCNDDNNVVSDMKRAFLVMHARSVEGDAFEVANSRSDYYHLMAETIYKLLRELEGVPRLVVEAVNEAGQTVSVMVNGNQLQLDDIFRPSGQATAASSPKDIKEWQQNLGPEFRIDILNRMIQSILPGHNPHPTLSHGGFSYFALYMKKLEGNSYEEANSKLEYYHLIAELTHRMQTIRDRLRRLRNEQQR